jgi:hypothetical protein
MTDPTIPVDPAPSLNARLEARLAALNQQLHRAYCMAVCVDRALRYNESDDTPELAVCVSEYLVRPLDALSLEADQLRRAFAEEHGDPQGPVGS